MNQHEFYQAHQIDGQLTEAQMAQLLMLPEGDTSTTLESNEPAVASESKPTDTPVENASEKPAEAGQASDQPAAADDDASPKVLLAKDGVHTIPYEKLVEARQGEQHWKSQAEAAQAAAQAAQVQLQALQQAAEQRAASGTAPTATDSAVAAATAAIENGVDPSIFGDFSAEDLTKGIQKLVQMGVEQATASLRGELSQVVKPIQEDAATRAREAHFAVIYAAHPEADSIAESAELAAWMKAQPSFVRDSYERVLTHGTANQVVEMFTAFKDATRKPAAPPAPRVDVAVAAQAAIANAKTSVPTSLSEIPAGSPAHHDEASAMLEMSGASLMSKFAGKSPEQIQEMLSRVL